MPLRTQHTKDMPAGNCDYAAGCGKHAESKNSKLKEMAGWLDRSGKTMNLTKSISSC